MIKIVINGQSISGEYTKTASDSVDYLRVYFSFSKEWQALVKTAQFTQEGKTYNALVEGGYCIVPSEISVGKVKLSVFGQMPGEALRITTLPFEFTMQKSGFTADGETTIPPTPDLYSQLVAKVQEAVDSVPEKLSDFENDAGYVTESSIPEKLSEFENDTGYITASSLPKKLSEIENDTGYITETAIPEKLSEFENDTGYITASSLPKKLSEIENDTGYITETAIPEKLSEFENDTGYITDAALPKKISQLENDAGFITGAMPEYDTVITSQAQWDAMAATKDFNGAKNIKLNCNICIEYSSKSTLLLPPTVLNIDGNQYKLELINVTLISTGFNTCFRNFKPVILNNSDICYMNGFYNNETQLISGSVQNCKNVIWCKFANSTKGNFISCDTVVFNAEDTNLFNGSNSNFNLYVCKNVNFSKTKLSEFDNDEAFATQTYVDELVGDIDAVLDEIHNYAQGKISGGEA